MKCKECGKNFNRTVNGFSEVYNYKRQYHKKCYFIYKERLAMTFNLNTYPDLLNSGSDDSKE